MYSCTYILYAVRFKSPDFDLLSHSDDNCFYFFVNRFSAGLVIT